MHMNEHEELAKMLNARLSALRAHLAKVDRELHKSLPADSEDQAIDLKIKRHSKLKKRPKLGKSVRLKPPYSEYPKADMVLAPSAESLLTQDA